MLQNRHAIASVSLGQHATHTLPLKIIAAAQAGFQGIEITHTDLKSYAVELSVSMLETASKVRRQCEDHNVEIIVFCPFENFEGQQTPLSDRLDKAREWLALTNALGAEHFQVPSNYDPNASSDRNVIVSELQQLSDLAATYNPAIKVAYENLGWGTHCNLWQHALQTVQDVDRDNFGLCLDSFHLCVALWADPFSKSGIQPNGPYQLQKSLHDMAKQLPLDKLFYLQLCDGEKLDPPYSNAHPWYDPALQPAHVWSNEARPFPFEAEYGGYMPVVEVAKAFLVDLGFTGWVSLETFDRRMREAEHEPRRNARRAAKSWKRLEAELLAVKPRAGRL